jgi:rare lipoprotein A
LNRRGLSGAALAGAALAGLVLALAGCAGLQRGSKPGGLHYVIGPPYEDAGGWHYPRAQFDYDETGLAVPDTQQHGYTEDGESIDPQAMAGAHPTLQLPAIAKITNLDTGLQVLVRINDRGPEQRGRLVGLTPRVFDLLGATGQPQFRVRVQVVEAESRRLAAQLESGGAAGAPAQTAAAAPVPEPAPVAAAAPKGIVQAEQLAPLTGAQQSGQGRTAAALPKAAATITAAEAAPIPLRLPEQVFRVPPRPGPLYVEAGTFGSLQYATILQARLAGLGAHTATRYDAPRDRAYRVIIGPLTSAAADAMLDRAAALGIAGARIVAE